MPAGQTPILLFDGVCNLCHASVQWVIRHDRAGVFRFASLQSEAGQGLLAEHGLATEKFDSVVLLADGQVFQRSDAALETARRLGGGWKWLAVFRFVPRLLRDWVYDFVARNRYRWFGRQTECWLPTPELRARFL